MREVSDIPEDDVLFLDSLAVVVGKFTSGGKRPGLILPSFVAPNRYIHIRKGVACCGLFSHGTIGRTGKNPYAVSGGLVANEPHPIGSREPGVIDLICILVPPRSPPGCQPGTPSPRL